ncbi:Uncharacterized conserved protein YybS, DUF2232 family [Caminicella sporogenes DSM 14501]|uniref:Uncharacterized conserved protein YybS, DUF2232 family n=1 Tax=Caminicella sporogenes DSM 14501 TaxID=1121266 RepID=A0A1M6NFX3_9FIRM|nr:DUF2232 domain-containing protein [Caminicella sporogenes]RKD22214.1 hypothetical protein BET04_06260 [Caminicella sporogenes]SHJ94600.1 Uncharacterized conserved protein YybS, DUF2232 family [Caminicella sporogenes DSM 14501]
MNRQNKTKSMVESALFAAIAVVFALAGIYLPLFAYALILLPVPFIIIGAKHGIKYNILSVLAASIIIGSMTEPLKALFIIVVVGFNSVVVGYMIEKKFSAGKTIFYGSIASIMASIISLTLLSYISGVNIIQTIEESFKMSNDLYNALLKNIAANPSKIEEVKKSLEYAQNMAIMLVPSSVIFSSIIITYINYIISGAVLRRMGYYIAKPRKFSQFRLPKNILMGTVIILVSTYLVRNLKTIDFETLFANVLYIFFIIYFVEGLSVIWFFLEKRNIGKGLRVFITIILLSIPSMAMIIMFIGLADIIINIRKIES